MWFTVMHGSSSVNVIVLTAFPLSPAASSFSILHVASWESLDLIAFKIALKVKVQVTALNNVVDCTEIWTGNFELAQQLSRKGYVATIQSRESNHAKPFQFVISSICEKAPKPPIYYDFVGGRIQARQGVLRT